LLAARGAIAWSRSKCVNALLILSTVLHESCARIACTLMAQLPKSKPAKIGAFCHAVDSAAEPDWHFVCMHFLS
jgi:hypothetical protein